MSNKTLTWVIVGVLVVLGAWFLVSRGGSNGNDQTGDTQSMTEGRVVFSVTDAAANMGAVSEVTMKISKVEMHSAAKGWVEVSAEPKSFNLLTLNVSKETELLADIKVSEGVYDQVKLTVDSVVVKMKDGSTKDAKLPSGELKLNTTVMVTADKTASVHIDVLADKSLHVTGNGKYIFAPVVNVESKSETQVSVDATGKVIITD